MGWTLRLSGHSSARINGWTSDCVIPRLLGARAANRSALEIECQNAITLLRLEWQRTKSNNNNY